MLFTVTKQDTRCKVEHTASGDKTSSDDKNVFVLDLPGEDKGCSWTDRVYC